MTAAEIDQWIGKNLFVPPIIKLCQLTRQTQFAVSRMFWFFAALDALYRADTVFSYILWGGLSVVMMISAVRRADHPVASLMFFRLIAVVLLCVDVVTAVVTREWTESEFWIFALLAEYAATIRTIPPSEKPMAKDRTVRNS